MPNCLLYAQYGHNILIYCCYEKVACIIKSVNNDTETCIAIWLSKNLNSVTQKYFFSFFCWTQNPVYNRFHEATITNPFVLHVKSSSGTWSMSEIKQGISTVWDMSYPFKDSTFLWAALEVLNMHYIITFQCKLRKHWSLWSF